MLTFLVVCISAYGPEDDDGRGGSSQHKSHDVSGGHKHNNLGANGHGQRHLDGTPCDHSQVERGQQGKHQGHQSGDGYSECRTLCVKRTLYQNHTLFYRIPWILS